MRIRWMILILIGLTTVSIAQNNNDKKLYLKTSNYFMDIKVDFDNNIIISTCKITVTNPTNESTETIPILLYRLMNVTSIKDNKGNPLSFTQQILSFEDWKVFQANYIEIQLDEPILVGESKEIVIEYSGYLLGYSETGMRYLQDRISTDYTMIRTDCLAYPILGYPSFRVNRAAGMGSFNYIIQVTVPDSLIVANGGKLLSKISENGLTSYTYRNIKPAWRIDIAISTFDILEEKNLKIFYMPKDSIGAKHIMQTALSTFDLYTQWWGGLDNFDGFSIIEIPDNWGSQADVTCILQTAAAFNNNELDTELYHEISHLWNVKPKETYPPRWDEGLAMFLQFLTAERLRDINIIDEKTNKYLLRIKTDESYNTVPLIDYGKENVTTRSYSMGMVMFSILYRIVGEHDFNKIIETYYKRYNQSGGSTEDFIKTANEISALDLSNFFKDWIYTTDYFALIQKDFSIDDLVKYYRK